MKELFRRLGIGIVYGIGFALGAAGVLAIAVVGGTTWFASKVGGPVSMGPSISSQQRTRTEQFVVSNASSVKNAWGGLNILGTIENTGEDIYRYVNVYADLFDKNGKFIYQCMKQFGEGLRKNEKTNFMMECHSMPKDLVPAYDSFKIHAGVIG